MTPPANTTTIATTNTNVDNKELAIELCEEANELIKQLKAQEDKNLIEDTTSTLSSTNIGDNCCVGGGKDHSHHNTGKLETGDEVDENKTIEQIGSLFSRAIEIDTQCIDAYLGLAYIKGMTKEYESVLTLLEKASEIDPTDERVSIMRHALEQELESQQSELDSVDDLDVVMDIGCDPKINIPFIITKGGITKKFLMVLREIFDRYDSNRDNSLNNKEMQSYSLLVNGQELDEQSMSTILGGYDSDKNGLTFTGFVELYVNQTIEDSTETLKDLKTLGYDSDLKFIKK